MPAHARRVVVVTNPVVAGRWGRWRGRGWHALLTDPVPRRPVDDALASLR